MIGATILSKKTTWQLASSALLWIAFYLPWTGSLSLVTSVYRSLAFLAVVTFGLPAMVIVTLGVLLAAFPLAGLLSLRWKQVPTQILWRISLTGFILLPAALALSLGSFFKIQLSLGYWLYGAGLFTACLAQNTGLARRQAIVPGASIILLLALGIAGAARSPQPETLALVNGTLIDGTGRAPMPDAVVLIRRGKIAETGSKAAVAIPPGAQVIDVQGGFVLPGFIDAHVHNAYRRDYLSRWAHSGVTTVCDVGAPVTQYFSLQRDLLGQDPSLARLVAAGPIMTVPDGYPIAVNNFPSLAVTSPDDAALKTTFLAGQGADVIKTALDSSSLPSLSKAELSAIVQTAHRYGRRVRVHQTSLASLELAVDAGVDIVDHVELSVPDEVIQAIASKQITWVPTLQVIQHFMSRDCSKTVRDFLAAGGRVAMGTDSGYYTFLSIGMPMYEINYLSQAGLNPMQVIVAATHNSAYACGINREVGTLEPGKTADVLVLSANPLDDLKALAQPKMVIHLGRVLEKTK